MKQSNELVRLQTAEAGSNKQRSTITFLQETKPHGPFPPFNPESDQLVHVEDWGQSSTNVPLSCNLDVAQSHAPNGPNKQQRTEKRQLPQSEEAL